ncbi:hypothetical protein ILUMI_04878 [Ignelater luminosus]|uniref:RNA-directed DNA polymerase n=1 Tax=Ignelater luminosus TaxID=2038154 RepID=A0A8K0DIT9_IGNLU|nr:hypothetical protein ILUMI_04878 [Ignelater luminosus]
MFGNRVVVPESLKKSVLNLLHVDHVGINRTKMLVRSYVWWLNLDSDIEHHIKSCSFLLLWLLITGLHSILMPSKEFMKSGGFTAPYNRRSNKLAERQVQLVKKCLIKSSIAYSNVPLKVKLEQCLDFLRATPSSVTGVSPIWLMLKFKPKCPVSVTNPRMNKSILKSNTATRGPCKKKALIEDKVHHWQSKMNLAEKAQRAKPDCRLPNTTLIDNKTLVECKSQLLTVKDGSESANWKIKPILQQG